MINLVAKSPAAGLVPVKKEGLTLSEVATGAITGVAPFNGRTAVVSRALKKAIGAKYPTVGRATGTAGARVVWSGNGQVLVLGAAVNPPGAAITDQSDAWTHLALDGAASADVLARLSPLDLRPMVFKTGHAARSLLGHMSCLFLKTDPERFEMLLFRSMAQTTVHEISRAMDSVTAQNALV